MSGTYISFSPSNFKFITSTRFSVHFSLFLPSFTPLYTLSNYIFRLKQQLDEVNASNAQLAQAVRDAELAHRAAGEQQDWFDDLRAQFSDLHKRYEEKCILC